MEYIYLNKEVVLNNLINLSQLTFEVTDACNLKCKYCGYGDLYQGFDERVNKQLPVDRAIRLLDMNNLYSILLSGTEVKKEKTQTFLRPLLSLGMIRLVEWTEGAIKPIQFPPVLNLQADVERAKKDGNSADSYREENVLLNLQSLQIDFPASGDTFLHEALCRLFDSLRKVFLYEIAFTGYRPVFNRAAAFWQLMRGRKWRKACVHWNCRKYRSG